MSLLPTLFSNWWEDLDRPHRLFDQHFGHGINLTDIERPISPYSGIGTRPHLRRLAHYRHHPYDRSLAISQRSSEADKFQTCCLKDNFGAIESNDFQVTLDVQQFSPEEITVKVVDKKIVVEGKHEEKQDEHGWISREFVRKYQIPENCDIDQVSSSISSDGILTVRAPQKNSLEDKKNERVIQIQYTGQPALKDASCMSSTDSQKEQVSQVKAPLMEQPSTSDKTVKAA